MNGDGIYTNAESFSDVKVVDVVLSQEPPKTHGLSLESTQMIRALWQTDNTQQGLEKALDARIRSAALCLALQETHISLRVMNGSMIRSGF